MVISQLLKRIRDIIGSSSDSAYLDAKVILKYVTGYDDVHIVVNKNEEVSPKLVEIAENFAEKRAQKMPVAYIVGTKEFMSLDFKVNENVLIPRADTECIVEEAIKLIDRGNVLDIGCGSGAIAISLAKYIPESTVTALDISYEAIKTTKLNASSNNVSVNCICCDIFQYNTEDKFDLIISNPPYIESCDIEKLMPDVRDFEPISALDGGVDGHLFYREITKFAYEHLNPGGYLIYEFGCKQHDDVVKIISETGLKFVNTIYDISGIKRGCTAKKI